MTAITFDPEDGRDYAAEMHALIEQSVPNGDYIAPLVAADLADKLIANDPALLAGWLWQRAQTVLSDVLARRSNSSRSAARAMAPRHAFAQAAEAYDRTGDPSQLRALQAEYVVNRENLRRRVADMTGADHLFVANTYMLTSKRASMLAAFHRAVAKKVGDRRTAEVFSEEQYLAMYRSIVGPAIAAA